MSNLGLDSGKSPRRQYVISANATQFICAGFIGLCSLIGIFFGGVFAGPHTGISTAQPAVTVTATATVTTTAEPDNGGGGSTESTGKLLFRKNHVQLSSGYALTFTDPSLQPFSTGGCTSGDLVICNGAFVGSSGELADYAGKAGFAQCNADTSYVSGATDFDQSLDGTTLCVTTTSRVAACYVTADTTQNSLAPVNALTMDCTVYAMP